MYHKIPIALFRVSKVGIKKYANNKVQTSKYNWFNFFPKNILEQFTKQANLYFLILAILQAIPIISISDGQPTILLPLIFILIVTMMKDLYEDTKRKKSDKQENENASLLESGQTLLWQDIRVGEVLKIRENEQFPCDVLLLKSDQKTGECYIETKNLDGETNLKQKRVPQYFLQKGVEMLDHLIVEYDTPNNQLYKFSGTCYFNLDKNQENDIFQLLNQKEQLQDKIQTLQSSKNKDEQISLLISQVRTLDEEIERIKTLKIALDNNNIILRGSVLKNTGHVIGLALYTGHDTKIMKNTIKVKYKQSSLEKQLGKRIIFIFLLQLGICLFSSLYYSIWFNANYDSLAYLEIKKSAYADKSFMYNFFVRLGNWILMFGNLVPISLLVTLETVKFCQAFLIQFDDKMKLNDQRCSVQSSNLNEELGQIQYILSDKTGTLTKNQMIFKKICINGISYGDDNEKNQPFDFVQFEDQAFIDKLNQNDPVIEKTLFLLTLCHSAIIQKTQNEFYYNVTSPDELALLNFAKKYSIIYNGIDEHNVITINFREKSKQFQFLYLFEFTSQRKCSSVLVCDKETNIIYLFSKGADSVMLQKQLHQNVEKSKNQFERYISEYSEKGLRILLLGYKEIHWSEYVQWESLYKQTITQMENRQEKMEALQDQLEKDLTILGLTGIEDKLQDNVDETIYCLRQAGINIWVLTGDKIETAINIAISCKLLDQKMNISIIQQPIYEDIIANLKQSDAFVVSGECLSIILEDAVLENLFAKITEKCQSVLCCRVSPLQKQQVVCFVRKHFSMASTLAIGDGANDVSMITSANVGVGIYGIEGQQAARASDYAIGEFQQLRQLLFVHGRESYRKNSELVLYNFYKNVILVFPQFWFSIYNNFSGQRIYDNLIYQAYNIFYTSMPILIFAIFDSEYSEQMLYSNKYSTYSIGQKNSCFNTKLFLLMLINSIYSSTIIAFFSIYIFEANTHQAGRQISFWYTGTVIFWLAILISNLRIVIISNTWTIAHLFFLLGMIVMFIFTLLIFEDFNSFDGVYKIFSYVFRSKGFYLVCILVVGSTSVIDHLLNKFTYFNKQLQPMNNRIYQLESQ
ncbi:unnamed protein product [Paramecium pentaurelia]|uniref:Phospholipid-transporting ATPase n=1 Tax=Paramecium pentaurelia TaxID=43138 RepID=A0A8S1VGH0_9CILI|nr:unnamed protein product [Paramecium pentaurelia]